MRRLVLLAALVLAGCSQADARPPAAQTPRQLLQVIDGDTVRLNGETIRISNIDAPELPPNARCWGEAGLAVMASEQLREFVNVSTSMVVEREGKDRYGRTLAKLQLSGHDVGQAMISSGSAAAWTGRKWDWCGPVNYRAPGAPDVVSSGPSANGAYSDWATKFLSDRILSAGK